MDELSRRVRAQRECCARPSNPSPSLPPEALGAPPVQPLQTAWQSEARRAAHSTHAQHALCVASRPLQSRLVMLLPVRQVLLRYRSNQRVL